MEDVGDNNAHKFVDKTAGCDVILVVGPDKVRLHVRSLLLNTVSKPLAAMLGPDWKEGHDMLDRSKPVELLLPEDNATVLRLICAVIHHRNRNVPQTLAAANVLQVAITADKYDCIEALKFASGNWLRPGKNDAGCLMRLTAAAFLFQNAQAFRETTKALVLTHSGPFLALSCDEVDSAITLKVFALLEEQRSSARLEFAEILVAGVNDSSVLCVHRCGWTSKYAYAYLKLLREKQLWPSDLLHKSLSLAMTLADEMPDPTPEETSGPCNYSYKHAAPEYRASRRRDLDRLNKSLGLCLHCVLSGGVDSNCEKSQHSA